MAEGIVIQLQREALDDSVDIETLLRKAYLVARKLQLKEFENWISQEQNGYEDKNEVPDYRTICGEIKAWNPYNGWIPVVFDGKAIDTLNKTMILLPISIISDLYKYGKNPLGMGVAGELTEFLNKSEPSFLKTNYSFQYTKSELHKIVSAVRNRILDWSILLEENGIIGEELKFTNDEIEAARGSQVINNYTNNFYSTAESTQIQQGGGGNQQ